MKAGKNRVEDHMTEYPSIANQNMTVPEAIEFMKQSKIRHLPVLEGGKVVGVVSDRDLRKAEILSDSMNLLVSDLMTPQPYCVRVGTPLSEVAKMMANQKYGCTVVLNHLDRVVGIFTTTDGMRVLGSLLSSEEPASNIKFFGVERFLSGQYLV